MSHRIAALVTVALLCLGAASEARAQSADLVAFNGKVFTARDGASLAQAFAVKDGRFVLVGPTYNIRTHIGADTKVVDLGGRFVVPGLGDAHFHNEGGGAGIDLSATRSIADLLAAVGAAAARAKPGELIVSNSDWHEAQFRDLQLGGIVGIVDLVDVVTQSDDPYFYGPFGFVLENARPLSFTPMRGDWAFGKRLQQIQTGRTENDQGGSS